MYNQGIINVVVYEPYIPLSATADLISSSMSVLFDDCSQPQLSYNTDEQACYVYL